MCPKKVADLAVGKSRSEINYIYIFLDQAGNRHVLNRLFILSTEEKEIHLTFLVHYSNADVPRRNKPFYFLKELREFERGGDFEVFPPSCTMVFLSIPS